MIQKSKKLVIGVDCKCYSEGHPHASIVLCSLHDSAAKLLEAIAIVNIAIEKHLNDPKPVNWKDIKKNLERILKDLE